MNAKVTFHHIEVSQIDDIPNFHAVIHQLSDDSKHKPEAIESLKKNPDTTPDFPFFFYLVQGGTIVASIGAIPDAMFASGKKYPWAWGGSLWTNPECRGQGLATKLLSEMTEVLHGKGIIWGGAFSNPITTRIVGSLGFTTPNRANRLLLMKTAKPFLKEHIKLSILMNLLNSVYRLAFKSYRLIACSSNTMAQLEVTPMDPSHLTDQACIEFFSRLDYGDKWHFNNQSDKIAWKLGITKNATFYLVSENHSKTPFMYLVVKDRYTTTQYAERYSDFSMMTLMDFGMTALTPRNYRHLTSVIEYLFWKSDADMLETVTSSPLLVSLAKRRGHLAVGQGVAYWFKAPSSILLPGDGSDIGDWYFTHFWSDAFSFE